MPTNGAWHNAAVQAQPRVSEIKQWKTGSRSMQRSCVLHINVLKLLLYCYAEPAQQHYLFTLAWQHNTAVTTTVLSNQVRLAHTCSSYPPCHPLGRPPRVIPRAPPYKSKFARHLPSSSHLAHTYMSATTPHVLVPSSYLGAPRKWDSQRARQREEVGIRHPRELVTARHQ